MALWLLFISEIAFGVELFDMSDFIYLWFKVFVVDMNDLNQCCYVHNYNKTTFERGRSC